LLQGWRKAAHEKPRGTGLGEYLGAYHPGVNAGSRTLRERPVNGPEALLADGWLGSRRHTPVQPPAAEALRRGSNGVRSQRIEEPATPMTRPLFCSCRVHFSENIVHAPLRPLGSAPRPQCPRP
jgi:hypothetical protein